MKLSILDRLSILHILPKEGSIVDLIQIKGIQESVEITAKEANEIGLEQNGNNLVWNVDKAKDKSFSPNTEQIIIIKSVFSKLDSEKKMTLNLLSLYDKFKVL